MKLGVGWLDSSRRRKSVEGKDELSSLQLCRLKKCVLQQFGLFIVYCFCRWNIVALLSS